MDEIISVFLAIFAFWGALIGLIIALIIAWIISSIIWGEFKIEVFIGFAIPCLLIGAYVQHSREKQ